MEEDSGVKAAPVTRLRRRLSVEQPESPSTPATPTMKKNVRLAAKPQLELIDEHATTNSSGKRPTRKSVSRAEPEEKTVTPARRSARVKSNTSLVSEAEEKPTTPSRRSTRIKSNTSIVSETTQAVASPRAKRAAARRTSQVGSDTELSLTPARTRRTRKASTSSVDKEGTPSVSETAATPGRTKRIRKGSTSSLDNTPAEASPADKPTSLITEVIVEEPENKSRKSTSEGNNVDDNNDSPTRKSPRLANKDRKSDASKTEETNENATQGKTIEEKAQTEDLRQNFIATEPSHDISVASYELIRDLDTKLNKKMFDKNKSMSDTENVKTKRNRTKSWTTLTSPVPDSSFCSDNETTKNKLKIQGKVFIDKSLLDKGSGDGHQQHFSQEPDNALETSLKQSKKSRKSKENSCNLNQTDAEGQQSFNANNSSDKENINVIPPSKTSSAVDIMLEKAPSEIKTTVLVEDSDSNTGSIEKTCDFKTNDTEDQCVPVVTSNLKHTTLLHNDQQNIFAVTTETEHNDSVEPMDIDETMPENVSLTVFSEEGKHSRKNSLCLPQESEGEIPKKSKRKSSLVPNDSQCFETSNEVKETNKKIRKSSINTSQVINESAENTYNKSKKKFSVSQVDRADKETPEISEENSSLSQAVDQERVKTSTKKRNSCSESAQRTISQISNETKSLKSSLSQSQDLNSSNETSTKSKRKLSLSNSVAQDLEKSHNENKSTLVLSQIKDLSATESNASKSPQDVKEKSINISQSAKDQPVNKNLALDYLTSTPVQQKNIEKLTIQMNTSMITPTDVSKKNIKDTSNTSEGQEIGYKKKKGKRLSESVCNESGSNKTNPRKTLSAPANSLNDPLSEDSEASDEEDSLRNLSKKNNKDTSNISEGQEIGYKKKKAKRLSESVCNEGGSNKTNPRKNLSTPANSLNNPSSDDSEASDEEDSLRNIDNLLDDEADDAGEDYESGDSQDEEERQYEMENEILEKGETLTSEDEDSNDTDYEKDSFIVSSNEEDEDLLSGSGDDLDMSNNELEMNAKSKQKYNERKTKEQKKASREMYEARHGLHKSDKAKSKKSRSRLDSTLLKSDDDNVLRKKNKRIRLDSSSLETSQVKSDTEKSPKRSASTLSGNEEIGYKKKKSKRLSESLYSESAMNEHEITIVNSDETKVDPLSINIKVKSKTAQKALEISTVQINEPIEHIHVEENTSIVNSNDTIDPLQTTMAPEKAEADDDYESISENEEIADNYDSILKELNKEWQKPIKSHDISLNLNKQTKKNKVPIVDELNLTETKISKKNKRDSKEAKEKSVKRVFKKLADDSEASRDSIDLNLLFSDESNKSNEGINKDDVTLIPLKRTEAKTDIHRSLDAVSDDNADVFNFFIDTKGDLANGTEDSDSNEPPVEIFYVNQKNKKSKKISDTVENTSSVLAEGKKGKKKQQSESEHNPDPDPEIETAKTPRSEKKKKKKALETSDQLEHSHLEETAVSEKKVRKISDSHYDGLQTETAETSRSEKKKKKKSESHNNISQIEEPKTETIVGQKVSISGMNISKTSDNGENEILDVTLAQKRKRETSAINTHQNPTQKAESVGSERKKLKISNSTEEKTENDKQGKILMVEEKTSKQGKITKNRNVEPETEVIQKSKKRKQRDEDEEAKTCKVFKEHSFDKVHVSRLPSNILAQLDDQPKQLPQRKKTKVISTTNFVVEESVKRKNKPSNFLEESIYLNHDDKETAQKKEKLKKPKVLPFLPTVSTSDSGFTTNFKVNILKDKMEFLAKSDEVPNFKKDYLNKKMKKLRTYDHYKKQRTMKLTKY